jgi:hypothetical protein
VKVRVRCAQVKVLVLERKVRVSEVVERVVLERVDYSLGFAAK